MILHDFSLSSFPIIFFDYYREVRFEEYFNDDADEDMLLFQYGCYDWGNGRYFEVDFTRQYYKILDEDDHAITQQRFTFYFEPTFFETVKAFNLWCHNRDGLSAFESNIIVSEGYIKALNYKPINFNTAVFDAC